MSARLALCNCSRPATSTVMPSPNLPDNLRTWIETSCSATVVAARTHSAGASRDAWQIDIKGGDHPQALFLLRDKNGNGSVRDAAVLSALKDTAIPVPGVIACHESLGTILLQRMAGRSDFPAVDDESEREPTARHLMELTAKLHQLHPQTLAIKHLKIPTSAQQCAHHLLLPLQQIVASKGASLDPFFAYALNWLQRHIPEQLETTSLVHSDMGPGNFLYSKGRVTAILDWEVAHFGDPMEDLAAISIRDMATPIGDLRNRFSEYQTHSPFTLDLQRVAYYRTLLLTRNSLFISLGLANPTPDYNVTEMMAYQALLMRAAALVICDNQQQPRPTLAQNQSPENEYTEGELRTLIETLGPHDTTKDSALAQYFALRMLAAAEHRRTIMGELADRLPQAL